AEIASQTRPRAAGFRARPSVGGMQTLGNEEQRQPERDGAPLPRQGGVERHDVAGTGNPRARPNTVVRFISASFADMATMLRRYSLGDCIGSDTAAFSIG